MNEPISNREAIDYPALVRAIAGLGIPGGKASVIADRLLMTKEPSILAALREWVATGTVSDRPSIEGHTPHELVSSGKFDPAGAFSALALLASDPDLGREFIENPPHRGFVQEG